ncbi:putative tyrosine protein phosphatase [Starmerella bacillaris]|uniref:M-phase inducer phosphatase n=1 Tax=Starmerella bacillaris TaxID=1247836 RepID=A0AAV5RQ43_STABA|nr:putative tyrosine protein phosphatase [Starmerella bacillaris]
MGFELYPHGATSLTEFSFSLPADGQESDFEDLSPCKPVRTSKFRGTRSGSACKSIHNRINSFSSLLYDKPEFSDPFNANTINKTTICKMQYHRHAGRASSGSTSSISSSSSVNSLNSLGSISTVSSLSSVSSINSPTIGNCNNSAFSGSRRHETKCRSPKKACLPILEVQSPDTQFSDCDIDTSNDTETDVDVDSPEHKPAHSEAIYHRPNNSVLGIPFSFSLGLERSEDSSDMQMSPLAVSRSKNLSSTRFPAKARRTQSLFATPEQLLQDPITNRPPVECLSVLEHPNCPLPTFSIRQDPFRRITASTLCRAIDGEFQSLFTDIIIIDCRFEYEYEGGHIEGAMNVNSKQQLEDLLFKQRECSFSMKSLLVFHCEHSAYRSPMLANHLRHCDRDLNASNYPNLFYPNVVVLEGGYSKFYVNSSSRCVPQNYIGMNHQEHQLTCEKELSKFRNLMKPRKSVSMNQGSLRDSLEFKFPPPPSAPLALRSVSMTLVESNQP